MLRGDPIKLIKNTIKNFFQFANEYGEDKNTVGKRANQLFFTNMTNFFFDWYNSYWLLYWSDFSFEWPLCDFYCTVTEVVHFFIRIISVRISTIPDKIYVIFKNSNSKFPFYRMPRRNVARRKDMVNLYKPLNIALTGQFWDQLIGRINESKHSFFPRL